MSSDKQDIIAVHVGIGLMAQYKKPYLLSAGVTVAACVLVLYLAAMNILTSFWLVALACTLGLGLLQMVYAGRLCLDLTILQRLADQPHNIEAFS